MKIDINLTNNSCKLKTLKHGDAFSYKGNLYIVTTCYTGNEKYYNVVNLSTGKDECFSKNRQVEKINAKIILDKDVENTEEEPKLLKHVFDNSSWIGMATYDIEENKLTVYKKDLKSVINISYYDKIIFDEFRKAHSPGVYFNEYLYQ